MFISRLPHILITTSREQMASETRELLIVHVTNFDVLHLHQFLLNFIILKLTLIINIILCF